MVLSGTVDATWRHYAKCSGDRAHRGVAASSYAGHRPWTDYCSAARRSQRTATRRRLVEEAAEQLYSRNGRLCESNAGLVIGVRECCRTRMPGKYFSKISHGLHVLWQCQLNPLCIAPTSTQPQSYERRLFSPALVLVLLPTSRLSASNSLSTLVPLSPSSSVCGPLKTSSSSAPAATSSSSSASTSSNS